ncbi:MAG TPA: chemotaxis protein [Bacillales bacterium]|nr:chemotaxis protein [Bacillales bacterium]
MTQKIAVAILHGIGSQKECFADDMIRLLKSRFGSEIKDHASNPEAELVFKPVFWASVFENEEKKLWERMKKSGEMDFKRLRLFVINYLADAIAYQPTIERYHNYDNVHQVFAESLQYLSEQAGETAPLCVIAHSLGSVIASNYFYDLQYQPEKIRRAVRVKIADTPFAKGETLTQLHTMGSSLALWSLRFQNFGSAIYVPAPKLSIHHPNLEGGWWNYYDKDDVLGYPLKLLNEQYDRAVTEDIAINVGGWLTSWNPFSHNHYATDANIINPIAKQLANMWKRLNK